MRARTLTVAIGALVSALATKPVAAEVSASASPNVSDDRSVRFELEADALGRGGFSIHSPMTVSLSRSLPLVDVFPTYSPESGLSPWGLGWDTPQLRVERRHPLGAPRFDASDFLATPWGRLSRSSTGRYLSHGITHGVEASIVNGNVLARTPDGTRFTFQDRTDVAGRGTAMWLLTRVEHVAGDAVDLSYARENGYPLMTEARWSRAGELTLKAVFRYKPVDRVIPDMSLGVVRKLSSRIDTISIFAPRLRTTQLTETQRFAITFDAVQPWVPYRVSDSRLGPGDPITRTFTLSYGSSFLDGDDLLPHPFPEAAVFPTYDDRDEGPAYNAHAMRSPGPTRAYVAADLEHDGVTDFMFWSRGKHPVWWLRTANGFDRRVFLTSNPDDRCSKFETQPIAVSPVAGKATTVLFQVRPSTAEPRTATVLECDINGKVIADSSVFLPAPDVPGCAPGSGVADASTIWRHSFVDINRDGVVDLVFSHECSIFVATGRRAGNALVFGDYADGVNNAVRIPVPELRPALPISYVDLNGDGVVDISSENAGAQFVWYGLANANLPRFTEGQMVNLPAKPAPDCVGMLANIDADPFVDRLMSCPSKDAGYFYLGSDKKLSLQGSQLQKGYVTLSTLGGRHGIGLQVIAKNPTIRVSASDPCPSGTRPSSVEEIHGQTRVTVHRCSPRVDTVAFLRPNSGKLTSLSDGEGHRLSFAYRYETPGFGAPRAVLDSFTEEIAGRDKQRHSFVYEIPQSYDTGFFAHFARVTVQEENATTGARGPRTRHAFKVLADTSVSTASDVLGRDGLLTSEVKTFTATKFEGVPWVRLDRTQRRIETPADGGAVVSDDRWTYTGGSICVYEHIHVDGDPGFGTSSSRERFLYAAQFTPGTPKIADPALQCSVTTHQLYGEGDALRLYNSYWRDEKDNVTGVGRWNGNGSRLVMFATNTYGADGLLESSQVTGEPPHSFVYEQGSTARMRLVKTEAVLKRRVEYERDPVFDFATTVRTRIAGKTTEWKAKRDARGRVLKEWTSGRGSEAAPARAFQFRPGTMTVPASVWLETRLQESIVSKSVSFLDGAGAEVASGSQWLQGEPTYRMRATASERDHEEHFEGAILSLASPATVNYDALKPSKLGDLVASLSASDKTVTTRRMAPGRSETWTTTRRISGGRLISTAVSDAGGHRTVAQSLNGRLVVIDDGEAHSELSYDELGRIESMRLPDGETQAQKFDVFGRISTTTRGGVMSTLLYFDGSPKVRCHRLEHHTHLENKCFEYNEHSLLKAITFEKTGAESCSNSNVPNDTGSEPFVYSYDENLELREVRGRGYLRETTFDGDGRLTQATVHLRPPGSSGVETPWVTIRQSYGWNWDGSQASTNTIIERNGAVALRDERKIDYAPHGLPRSLRYGDLTAAVELSERASRFSLSTGHVLELSHKDRLRTADVASILRNTQEVFRQSPTFGPGGRIEKDELTFGGAVERTDFAYQGGRLAGATIAGASVRYQHTPGGLLKSRSVGSTTHQITRSATELRAGDDSWKVDDLGRVVGHGDNKYCWAPSQQIALVQGTNGKTVARFFYDESGRRIMTATWGAAGSQPRYHATFGPYSISNDDVTTTLDAGGRRWGTYRADTFTPIPFDRRASSRVLKNGKLESLSPYGERPSRGDLEWADYGSGSHESSLEMIRFGHRDYLPGAGQFASADPLFLTSLERCARDPIACNLYGYTAADPVNQSDPTGLIYCINGLCPLQGDGSAGNPYRPIEDPPNNFTPGPVRPGTTGGPGGNGGGGAGGRGGGVGPGPRGGGGGGGGPGNQGGTPDGASEGDPAAWADSIPPVTVSGGATIGLTFIGGWQASLSVAMDTSGNIGIQPAVTLRLGPDIAASFGGLQWGAQKGNIETGFTISTSVTADLGLNSAGVGAGLSPADPVCDSNNPNGDAIALSPGLVVGRGGPSLGLGIAAEGTLGFMVRLPVQIPMREIARHMRPFTW